MPDLDIREIHLLRGPNIWANYPVLDAWVDLGGLNDASSEEIPGFNDRLKSWLPGMIEHRCSEGEHGGFFKRLDRGTCPAHILEHVTLELQTQAGHRVGYDLQEGRSLIQLGHGVKQRRIWTAETDRTGAIAE